MVRRAGSEVLRSKSLWYLCYYTRVTRQHAPKFVILQDGEVRGARNRFRRGGELNSLIVCHQHKRGDKDFLRLVHIYVPA